MNNITIRFNVGGLAVVLFLIFLVLKLIEEIDWSWWWVTSPLWIVLAIAVLGGIFSASRR